MRPLLLPSPVLVIFLLAAFGSVTQAAPITIVNTGPGPTSVVCPPPATCGAYFLFGQNADPDSPEAFQFLAGQFTVDSQVIVTSLEGWIRPFGYPSALFNVGVHTDSLSSLINPQHIPGTELFTEVVSVGDAATPSWLGATDISLILDPGTYWIVFSVPSTGGMWGYMPYPSLSPLEAEAFRSGSNWQRSDGLNLGVRILGDDCSEFPGGCDDQGEDDDDQGENVPDPGSTLLLLGMGLVGLGAWRKRCC